MEAALEGNMRLKAAQIFTGRPRILLRFAYIIWYPAPIYFFPLQRSLARACDVASLVI
jgi:hypothetical protein